MTNAKHTPLEIELLQACKDAKRQIEMMIERMPLDSLAASDSMMFSELAQIISKAERTKP